MLSRWAIPQPCIAPVLSTRSTSKSRVPCGKSILAMADSVFNIPLEALGKCTSEGQGEQAACGVLGIHSIHPSQTVELSQSPRDPVPTGDT
jgi:hypothetical protein